MTDCTSCLHVQVMNVVFLVVVGDVLVGNPELCNGLVCELTGVSSGPLVDRRVLLGALSLLVSACDARALSGGTVARHTHVAFVAVSGVLWCAWWSWALCWWARNTELCDGLICELTGVSSRPLVDRRVLLGVLSLLVRAWC